MYVSIHTLSLFLHFSFSTIQTQAEYIDIYSCFDMYKKDLQRPEVFSDEKALIRHSQTQILIVKRITSLSSQ